MSWSGVPRGGDAVVENEKEDNDGEHDVAGELPVAPAGLDHVVDPVEGAAHEARDRVHVAVHLVEEALGLGLGLVLDVDGEGLEARDLGGQPLGPLLVLAVYHARFSIHFHQNFTDCFLLFCNFEISDQKSSEGVHKRSSEKPNRLKASCSSLQKIRRGK